MSKDVSPMACTMAQQHCGASHRCKPFARTKIAHAPLQEQLEGVLRLCGNRGDFLAALDIAAECPGNQLQTQMRNFKQAVQNVPESSLCAQAVKEVRKTLSESVPFGLPPDNCIRAHNACSLDATCSGVVQKQSHPETLMQDILHLCDNKLSFLRAMQVASACPGPQQQELQSKVAKLAALAPGAVCQEAHRIIGDSDAAKKPLLPSNYFTKLAATNTDKLTIGQAEKIISVFDVAPHDKKLNALEWLAMLAELKLSSGSPSKTAESRRFTDSMPDILNSFNLKAVDSNRDDLIEPAELVARFP
jgi:hypothetical protein